MFELMKKTVLTGIGLAAMTKDKVEQSVRDLIKKGALTEKEGKELVSDLLDKSEQAKKDLELKIESNVQKILGKMGVATKEDIARLEEMIKKTGQKN